MGFRMEKVNAEMQKALSQIINEDVRNPELDDCVVTITEVKTSPDFSQARVYISVLNTKLSSDEIIKEVNSAIPFIKRRLSEELNLKRTPDLSFEYDSSIAQGERIMQLLDEINHKKDNK